jgi:hypothetical protein
MICGMYLDDMMMLSFHESVLINRNHYDISDDNVWTCKYCKKKGGTGGNIIHKHGCPGDLK